MIFRYYFFKEQNRIYDIADLLAFLCSQSNSIVEKVNEERRVVYHNELLDFDATFIVGNKSVVPNLHQLDPKYLDLNIRVEFNVLLSTYKVDLIVDIIENMCKRFNFAVYNELFEDVYPFKKSMLIKSFEIVKKAYKEKYEEEIMQYYRLEKNVLADIYHYVLQKERILLYYKADKIVPLDYVFLAEPGIRRAYPAVIWDGLGPFIIPPHVEYFIYLDGDVERILNGKDVFKKINRFFKPLDSTSFNLDYVNLKDYKKVKKTLNKGRFSTVSPNLKKISLDKILDL